MIRRSSLVRKRPELSTEEFLARWTGEHVELAKLLPGLRGYLALRAAVRDARSNADARPARRASPRAGSKAGAIQVRWTDNESDLATLVTALRTAGYAGAYCVEYVPMPKWRCDELDVVTEALATRDALIELGVT